MNPVSVKSVPILSPVELKNKSLGASLLNTIKKIIIFIRVQFSLLLLNIKYFLNRIENVLSLYDRYQLFNKNIFVPYAGNHGKRQDIPRFLSPLPSMEKENTWKNLGYARETSLVLNPFGEGNCLGASSLFCKRWIETQDIQQVANEFKEGAPFEAVLMQSAYIACIEDTYYFNEPLYKVLHALIESSKAPRSKDISLEKHLIHEINRLIKENELPSFKPYLVATALYLLEAPPQSYLDFMIHKMKEMHFPLKGGFYSTIREVDSFLESSLKQFEWDCLIVAGKTTNVNFVEQKHFEASATTVLNSVQSWEKGAYLIETPVYNCLGIHQGYHALAFIKAGTSEAYLYDPNITAGFDTQPKELLKRSFEIYCGEVPSNKTILQHVLSALKKTRNFFLFRANPPLFSRLENSYSVYKIG